MVEWLSDNLLGWLGPRMRWEPYTHWYTWRYLLLGLKITVEIAVFTAIFTLIVGIIVALLRTSPYRWLSLPAAVYVEGARSLPALLLVLFTFLAAPKLHIDLSAMNAAIAGFTIYNAAVMAEIVRAGIASVPRSLLEASRSLGLTYIQVTWYVALPIALRRMTPALVGQVITINTDTSFASVISVQELLRRAEILGNTSYNPIQNLLVVAGMYWLINFSISLLSRRAKWHG
jgi:His/Glu/Gln/Arg/opine family amino acid ABC transporter permease subunit